MWVIYCVKLEKLTNNLKNCQQIDSHSSIILFYIERNLLRLKINQTRISLLELETDKIWCEIEILG